LGHRHTTLLADQLANSPLENYKVIFCVEICRPWTPPRPLGCGATWPPGEDVVWNRRRHVDRRPITA